MKKVRIYCGETVTHLCGSQRHPVTEVMAAQKLIDSDHDVIAYSNHPDFVSAIKYIGLKKGIKAEFFLDGVSKGNDIEPIFADFNRALDLINELGLTVE